MDNILTDEDIHQLTEKATKEEWTNKALLENAAKLGWRKAKTNRVLKNKTFRTNLEWTMFDISKKTGKSLDALIDELKMRGTKDPDRIKAILKLRLAPYDDPWKAPKYSYLQLGAMFNVSDARIRQILVRGFDKIISMNKSKK